MDKLVSIIIPVYNGGEFLTQAIDSALAQTYANIEIIVVNDGSDDSGRTESIIYSYGNKIKYINKPNGGVSSALNVGIREMKGEFFSWLSHDDLYHKDKIKKQMELVNKQKNTKVIIFTKNILIDKNNKKIYLYINKTRKRVYNPLDGFKLLLSNRNFNGCSLLIPRIAFEEVGFFDEKLKYIQDWKMWIKFADKGYSFLKVNKPLNLSRVHKGQQTLILKDIYPEEVREFLKELIKEVSMDNPYFKEKIKHIYRYALFNDYKDIQSSILKNNLIDKRDKLIMKVRYNTYGRLSSALKNLVNKIRRRR